MNPWFLDGPMKGKSAPMGEAKAHIYFPVMEKPQWHTWDGYAPPPVQHFRTVHYRLLGKLRSGRPIYAYEGD